MAGDVILEMQNICKQFPGVTALNNVDFELRKGEVHVLIGENGAGKSTLMKILSGVYPKTSGVIKLAGEHIEIKSPKHAQELGVSTIYQELNLVPHLTVSENILLGRETTVAAGFINQSKNNIQAQILLDDLDAKINAKKPVKELGIAKKQMVEIAKALSIEAKILIMDEPTSALTEKEIHKLFEVVRKLKEAGRAIIYISHRLDELYEIADRVTVLRDGKTVKTSQIQNITQDELIRLMVNRDLTDQFPGRKPQTDEIVLAVSGLSVKDKIQDIDFTLRKGEILGIFGLLGSGRTELACSLFGLERISKGKIEIKGVERNISSPRKAIDFGLGYVTEDRKGQGLVLIQSVKNNIILANINNVLRFGIINGQKELSESSRFVKELKIKTPSLNQRVLNLSGGNQQKIVLSKWLFCDSDIFIFDEPTRGIDVGAKYEIYQLLNALVERGASIIMISSELPELFGMSDRIIVMHDGQIVGEYNANETKEETILQCALGDYCEN